MVNLQFEVTLGLLWAVLPGPFRRKRKINTLSPPNTKCLEVVSHPFWCFSKKRRNEWERQTDPGSNSRLSPQWSGGTHSDLRRQMSVVIHSAGDQELHGPELPATRQQYKNICKWELEHHLGLQRVCFCGGDPSPALQQLQYWECLLQVDYQFSALNSQLWASPLPWILPLSEIQGVSLLYQGP